MSLVHLLKGLFRTLDLSIASRNLAPVPVRILEDTELLMKDHPIGSQSLMELWIESFLEPTTIEEAATTGEVVRSIMGLATGAQKGMVRAKMIQAGFAEDRIGAKRYFVKMFEDPDPTSKEKKFDYTKPLPVGIRADASLPHTPFMF